MSSAPSYRPNTALDQKENCLSKGGPDATIHHLLDPVCLVEEAEIVPIRFVSERIGTIEEFKQAEAILKSFPGGLPIGKSLRIFISTSRIAQLQKELHLRNVTTSVLSKLKRLLRDLDLEISHKVGSRVVREGRLFIVGRKERLATFKSPERSSVEGW
jgi:hypothetical protein